MLLGEEEREELSLVFEEREAAGEDPYDRLGPRLDLPFEALGLMLDALEVAFVLWYVESVDFLS